jgi:hypothetical protein
MNCLVMDEQNILNELRMFPRQQLLLSLSKLVSCQKYPLGLSCKQTLPSAPVAGDRENLVAAIIQVVSIDIQSFAGFCKTEGIHASVDRLCAVSHKCQPRKSPPFRNRMFVFDFKGALNSSKVRSRISRSRTSFTFLAISIPLRNS